MNNIKTALVATIQQVKNLYDIVLTADEQIALPFPGTYINPIIEKLNNPNLGTTADSHKNNYNLALLTNMIVKKEGIWNWLDQSNLLWNIYQQFLDPMKIETTDAISTRWVDEGIDFDLFYNRTDIDSQSSYKSTQIIGPTSPSDWKSFTINATEFNSLYQKAKTESYYKVFDLFNNLPDDNIQITKISFEYGEVKIIRDWLDMDLLNTRLWRIKNDRKINSKDNLSNGIEDYSGALPGFLTKMILIRNLSVEFEVPNEEKESTKSYYENGHIFDLGHISLGGRIYSSNGNKFIMEGLKVSPKVKKEQTILPSILLKKNLKIESLKHISNKLIDRRINTMKLEQSNGQVKEEIPSPKVINANKNRILENLTAVSSAAASVNTRPMMTSPTVPQAGWSSIKPTLNTGFLRFTSPSQWTSIFRKIKFGGTILDIASNTAIKDASLVFSLLKSAKKRENPIIIKTNHKGDFFVTLTKNKYKLRVIKNGYEKFTVNLDFTKARGTKNANYYLKRTAVLKEEKATDIQLLFVVYKKLGMIPNPIDNFDPAGSDIFE